MFNVFGIRGICGMRAVSGETAREKIIKISLNFLLYIIAPPFRTGIKFMSSTSEGFNPFLKNEIYFVRAEALTGISYI